MTTKSMTNNILYLVPAVMLVFLINTALGSSVFHLSQVEEKAGVLSGLRQVRQEHSDADQ